MAAQIYVIRCRFLCQIGVAKDPAARLEEMCADNPFKDLTGGGGEWGEGFKLELVLQIPTDHPRRDLRHWRAKFHDKHAHDDWFRLTDHDLDLIRQGVPGALAEPARPRTRRRKRLLCWQKARRAPDDYLRELALLDWCNEWVRTHPNIDLYGWKPFSVEQRS
jgi:hypothetical protein